MCIHNTIYEVERMRTTRRKKQSVFNVTKVMLLVICLIATFAVVLSTIDFDVNVAHGGTEAVKDGDDSVEVGTASEITGDNGAPTAKSFGFTQNNTSEERIFNFTDTFNNLEVTRGNHAITKSDGNTDIFTWIGGISTSSTQTGQWKFGVKDAAATNKAAMVLNYHPGEFVAGLMQRPDITVSASFTITFNSSDNRDGKVFGITSHQAVVVLNPLATNTNLTATEALASMGDFGNGTNNVKTEDESNYSGFTSNSVTLTKDNPKLAMGIGFDFIYRDTSSRDVWMEVLSLKVNLKITLKDSSVLDSNENGNLFINDYSSPVVSKQFINSGIATQTPYITGTDANSGWAVYDDSFSSFLSKYTDNMNLGSGKMLSFTSTPLTRNGKTYYKSTSTQFTDTYDYSGAGGFNLAALQKLYDEGGVSAVQAALPYMGFGLSTISNIDVTKLASGDLAGAITWVGGADKRFAAGIKTVQVGDARQNMDNENSAAAAVFNVWEIAVGGTATKDVYVDGVKVGWAEVRRDDRATVTVHTYMQDNARVRTVVTDFGDKPVTTDVTFAGIDTKSPEIGANSTNSGVAMEDTAYINAVKDASLLDWYRQNVFSNGANVEVYEDSDSAAFSPYVWFYTVQMAEDMKYLTTPRAFNSYAEIKAAGLDPIGLNELTTFEFDFTTGKAKGFGSTKYEANGTPLDDYAVSGNGYYLFTFYTVDLAGNIANGTTSFYVKADTTTPTYTIDLSYLDSNDNPVSILASENGIKWATGKTTLTISINLNFSGNSIIFEDANNTYMLTLDGSGDRRTGGRGYGYANLVSYGTSLEMHTASSNQIALNLLSNLQPATANVSVALQDDGSTVDLTFVFDDPAQTIAFITEFNVYAGQYDKIESPDSDEMATSYINPDWKDGVHVLIDRTAPQTPELNDAGENENLEVFNYEFPSTRNWYTAGYKYDLSLAFQDILVNSDYANGIKVYAGMKYLATASDIDALKALDIENVYGQIDESNFNAYFDRLQTRRGDELEGDETLTTFDLVQEMKGGMRALFVWVVDQAGNISAINKYYVLADNTTYVVNSGMLINSALGSTATIDQSNGDDTYTTSFKRGESVFLTLGVNEGYVPFALTKNVNGVATTLLENYTPTLVWALSNDKYNDYLAFGDDYSSVEYIHDDPDSLASLDAITTLTFAHRQVITRNITNTQIAYTSLGVVIPMTLNNDNARDSFEFKYFDKDGAPISQPIKVGEYKVQIYIAKDNASYVTSDFAMDQDGNQMLTSLEFGIIRGNAIVTANATQSIYGDTITLSYTLSGIVEENLAAEGINFELALKIDGYTPGMKCDAGQYQIIANGLLTNYDNYNVEFRSAYHTVAQRNINIYAWSATKTYGSQDPTLHFGLKKGEVTNEILVEAFGGLGYNQVADGTLGGDEYYLFEAGNRISRANGENVGEYAYTVDTALFEVSKNFKVVAQSTQRFVITQRVVTLEVGGQSTLLPYGTDIDLATIKPSYTLTSEDSALASEIAMLVGDSLTLDSVAVDGSDASYSQVFMHTILLGATGNENISLVLGDDTTYIIYIALQNAIIISVKDGVVFEYTYGVSLEDILKDLVYSDAKFDISGEVPAHDSIVWTASVEGAIATPNAGGYIVKVSGANLVVGGENTADAVFVEDFTLTINPATIIVNPTATAFSKVYGDSDNVYGIGYEISSIEGVTEGVYAGMAFDDIKATLSGSFVRARYTAQGVFRSFGSMYDDATNAGVIISNAMGEGEYYSWAIGSAFSSHNANFNVVANFDDSVRFEIAQKQIVLYTANFVGVNKSFDNTYDVHYSTTKAYDLTSSLARANDEVYLVYNATYMSAGSALENTPTSIIFTNLAINGASANNYVLTTIENDGVDVVVSADGAITSATSVTIKSLDNAKECVGANKITIYFGQIGVHKTDVTIIKEYDNTTSLTIDGVSIANTSDAEGIGTAILAQIASRGDARVLDGESDEYSGTGVSANYSINTLTLFFPLANADDVIIVSDYDRDVVITVAEYEGVKGIKVVLKNMPATISARVIDADSFESIKAVDRDYNATGIVNTEYVYSVGALAEGDTVESVGLELRGMIEGGVVNVGSYSVDASSASLTQDNTHSYIANSNYVLDTVSINNKFDLSVTINRAKLMPNVTFVDKEYDNSTNIDTRAGIGGGALTTLRYADNLKSELDQMVVSGTITYALSQDGKLDSNVQQDLLHNVMVSGLTITADSALLANYEIYGSRYIGGEYMSVGMITSGALIADYEMLDVVRLTKKHLPIISNNVIIEDKIYDGTNIANITIKISPEHVPAEHLDLLEIIATGTFARRQVGNNIVVNIGEPVLSAKTEEGRALLHNYELQEFSGRFSGNIIPQPVVLGATLGEKVYNGETDIFKGNIVYSFDGIRDADRNDYAVQTNGGAHYIDGDVNVERDAYGEVVWYKDKDCTSPLTLVEGKWVDGDGIEATNKFAKVLNKAGTIYNPTLANTQEKYINYILTVASNYVDDSYVAYKLATDSEPRYYQTTTEREGVTFYYPLPSTNKYVESVTDAVKDYVVGAYKLDGILVYIVSSDCEDESVKTLDKPLTYLTAEGKITQRMVYIKADGIKPIEGTTAFTKKYDATNKFFGVRDVDYEYVDGSIANVIAGDVVDIAHITADFDSSFTSALYVLFSATGIAGKDAYKYTIDTTSPTTMSVYGKITKQDIVANLADGEIVYGTSAGDIEGDITYQFISDDGRLFPLVWSYEHNSFFVKYQDALIVAGFIENAGDPIKEGDEKYVANYVSKMYNLNPDTGLFDKVAEGEMGEYLKLSGTFTLPSVDATFASARPGAGAESTSYTLTNGNALNFAFVPRYTNDDNTSSSLTVVRRDLHVSTDGLDVSKIYGGNDPRVSLVYNNRASFDIGQRIFIIDGVDYNPELHLAIFNSTTGVTTEVAEIYGKDGYAPASKDLADDEHYVYVLKAPEGVDYSTLIANYNVYLCDINVPLVLKEDGEIVFAFGDGDEHRATKLTITLPTLDGVSIKAGEHIYVYTEENKVAVDRTKDVVQGAQEGDEITYIDSALNPISAANAGVYNGLIKVSRHIKVDENDPNQYHIEWVSPSNVTITINRASIEAVAGNAVSMYNGKVQKYDTSGSSPYFDFSHLTLSENDFVIKTQKQVGGQWVDAQLKDAGTYKVIITTRAGFEDDYKNYQAVRVEATYTITKAAVNITLSTDGYTLTQDGNVKTLSTTFIEGGVYTVGFSVSMADPTIPSNAKLDESDLSVVLSNGNSEVDMPGRYSFKIVISNEDINASNYNIVGGSGQLEIIAKTLVANEENTIHVEEGFLANRFVVREIVGNNTTHASDEAYLAAIRGYMPLITEQGNLKTDAELVAVLVMKLYCGNDDVSLGGRTMRVSLAIPDSIDSLDGIALYIVNQEGGLTKLTNYQVVNGKIEYSTDYLGALVFVDIAQPYVQPWAMYVGIGVGCFVALLVLVVFISMGVKKAKMKKLD